MMTVVPNCVAKAHRDMGGGGFRGNRNSFGSDGDAASRCCWSPSRERCSQIRVFIPLLNDACDKNSDQACV